MLREEWRDREHYEIEGNGGLRERKKERMSLVRGREKKMKRDSLDGNEKQRVKKKREREKRQRERDIERQKERERERDEDGTMVLSREL